MMFNLEVKPVEEKFGLYMDGQLIGTSKARFDADFAAQVLEKKIIEIIEEDRL